MELATGRLTQGSASSPVDMAFALVPGISLSTPKKTLVFPLRTVKEKPLRKNTLAIISLGEEIVSELQDIHARRKEFNRGQLVEQIKIIVAKYLPEKGEPHAEKADPKFKQTYAGKALVKTLAKLEEYIATRPALYCIAWANDFACKIQALAILTAYELDSRLPELESHQSLYKSLLYNAYSADALRACKISDRDKMLFGLREVVNLHRPIQTIEALRAASVKSVARIGTQGGFCDLPSSRWAGMVSAYLAKETDLFAARNVLWRFTGLLQAENHILREIVPSELWGTKTQPTPDKIMLSHDKTDSHVKWTEYAPASATIDVEELHRVRNLVVAAKRHLIPQGSMQPVIEFPHLPHYLKTELVAIQLLSKQHSLKIPGAPGLRNPDDVATLDKLERRGYVTHVVPINQTILCAYQVQYSSRDFSENEQAILKLARAARPHLATKQPVFVRLIIKDDRDDGEAKELNERPYEQLLNATLDRVLSIGAEDPSSPKLVDPRRLFLFAIVREDNTALGRHQKRGWEDVGAIFTLTKSDMSTVRYRIIVYDPETLKA